MKSEKIKLIDRLLIGAFNGFLAFILIGVIEFYMLARRGGSEGIQALLSGHYLWLGAIVFFVLGFVLGPKKMANLWGKIFGTNKS